MENFIFCAVIETFCSTDEPVLIKKAAYNHGVPKKVLGKKERIW